MKEKERLTQLLPTFFIVILAIISFAFYNQSKNQEDAILVSFTNERNILVAEGLQTKRQTVEQSYAPLFVDCDERAEYDQIIEKDSRSMSASELRRALELHALCGKYFVHKSLLTLGFYEEDVEDLRTIVSALEDSDTKKNAISIVQHWEQILALEKEHSSIYERMVAIQEEYWTADFNKAVGSYSSKEREEVFGELNTEANKNIDRLSEIQKELSSERALESSLWSASFGTGLKKE